MRKLDHIRFERKGSRAELVLNRPPKNLLNVPMLEEIVDVLEPLLDDDSLKVMVVRGSSGNFCSGIETSERAADRAGLMMPVFTRMFDFLNQVCGVIISVVEGEVCDGGFELAAFCDLVFASENVTFCFSEINLGLFPPVATAVLPRLVGRNIALEWIISGKTVTAKEAFDARLVNRILPEHKLLPEVEHFAARINSLSAPAVVWAKRAINRSLYAPVMQAMRTSESTYMVELMRNIDPHEGIKAAIEGRPPVWRNL